MQPLKGLTVVTLEHAIAAPFATRQLADLGARVIKIERPGVGDFARSYDSRVRGLASHFVWTNRSKESLTLDVKHPEAAKVLERLVLEKADVVVQNLAPGAAARLGLGYERLAADEAFDHRLRHLGLRRRRSLPRQEGLRPADPERGRLRLGDRHGRRTVQGGPFDRRHRGRHVRLHQHPGRLDAAGADRQGPAHRHLDAGVAGRMDQLPAVLRLRWRAASAPHGRGPRHHLPLRAVPHRRWRQRDARPAERARMGQLLREGAAAARPGDGSPLHRQRQARGRTRWRCASSSSKRSGH